MQIKRLLFCLGTVVAPFSVAAQGTFQNLDFEQAVEVPTYPGSPFLWAAEALPGWTPYVGGVPQTEVERNSVLLGGVGLADPAGSFNVLDGSFSALLGGPGLSAVPISIGQSGTIPAGS
ncbi:MAG TPA: hypothetical protein VN829_02310, partial [Dongiaceae bacterium]|nr:hypothetical protein [Dongiaceae bacterium]